jgi:ectoine hydroxylase
MLPREDPIVHGRNAGPLDGETVERFERDGFWVAPNLLSLGEVEVLTDALEAWREEPLGDVSDGVIRERESGEQRSLFALHQRHDALGAVMRHPLLVGAARQILGGDVYVHQSRLNLKPAFGGAGFSWHSDFETWHAEDGMPRMRALSASVLLTENHAWNGPLMLLPGSHRHFVTSPSTTPPDHYRASLVEQSVGTPSNDALRALFDDAGRIDLAVGGPGTVVFFDCNTMHASTANLSPLPRRNLFVCYNAIENALVEPFGATPPRPGFLASRDFTPIR